MKKLILTAALCLSISCMSCGDSNKNTGTETKTSGKRNPGQTGSNNAPKDTLKTGTTDTKSSDQNRSGKNPAPIRIHFPGRGTQMTMMDNIEGPGDIVTYIFEASKGQKLTASVTTQNKGNVRFNQIIDPSGNADGPFANQMTYDLNQSGDWKLVIGESNMLGTPYTGKFTFQIQIK